MRWLLLLIAAPLIAATGDITAIRVLGSVTGVSGATSACNTASACTGWVAEIDAASLSTGGTYALGMTGNHSPASAKIVCSVTSSGYDATGTLGTTTRTVYGTHALRKVYNATLQASPPYPSDETVVSGTLTLRIALSDALYSGDTATCNVGAGIYTQGGTPTNAATGVTVTNNSTLAYWQVRAIENRSWPGNVRISATLDGDHWNHANGSFTVRAMAFQRHPRNGLPMAAMKFTLTGQSSSHVETVTVTAPTVDPGMTQDPTKEVEYVATFSSAQIANFTQGELARLDYAAYPWVGDATAVMDTADNVNAAPSPLYSPQYYIVDRTGAFGTSATVVEPTGTASPAGNDSTCVAIAESAFNHVSDAATLAPCLTVRGAAVKMTAFNNTNYSRHDLAGTMYIQAGNVTWTGSTASLTADSGTNASQAWLTVTPFPGVAKSAVVINAVTDTTTNNKLTRTSLHIKGLTISITSGAPTELFQATGTGAKYLWLDSNDLTMTSGSSISYNFDIVHYTYNTTSGEVKGFGAGFSNTSTPGVMRGNSFDNIAHVITGCTLLGNTTTIGNTVIAFKPLETAAPTICTQPIIAFNRLHNLTGPSGGFMTVGGTLASPTVAPGVAGYAGTLWGAAVIQNDIEINLTNQLINAASDGTTNTPVQNLMMWYNTLAGGRINGCYDDVTAGTFELRTLWSYIGNIWEASASKHDTFGASPNAGRVGAWACLYGVGWYGGMDVASSYASAGDWQPEWPGISTNYVSVGASLDAQASPYNPPRNATPRAYNYPGWTTFAGWNGTSTGAGNGTYTITAGSPAIGLIPSGLAALPVDLAGVARKNDSTGAAGAYEYVSSGSVVRHRVIQ